MREFDFYENRKFIEHVVKQGDLLQLAVKWIGKNVAIEDIHPESYLREWVLDWVSDEGYVLKTDIASDYDPQDFFSHDQLAKWAEENGYSKEEK